MRSSLLAGTSAAILLLSCGCQSMNWTAKNKKDAAPAVAEHKAVRDIPWSEWKKKKDVADTKDKNTSLPADIQAKIDKANSGETSTKTAAEWVAEGNQMEVGRNFAAATKAYESALAIDPVNAEAHHRLGIMADMREEYGTARDHYEAAMRQKPHDANLLSDFGYSMHLQGKAQQGERYLLQSLDIDPQHKQALKNLVSLYATQNRYDDAAQVCRRLRPEAEAQRLLAQAFPKDQSNAEDDPVALASGQNPRQPQGGPQASLDPGSQSLKNKSVEELYQEMAKARQAGIQSRQQKSLKELRPEFQESMTQDDWANSQPPVIEPKTARQGWAQNLPTEVPEPVDSPAIAVVPPSSPMKQDRNQASTGSRAFPEDVPLWSGAPLTAKPAVPETQVNSNPGAPPADQSLAMNEPRNDLAGRVPGFGLTNSKQQNSKTPSAAQLRAYQLAMSAGPGTMFPVMPAENAGGLNPNAGYANQPALNRQPPAESSSSTISGPPPWASSTSPSGYSETRVAPLESGAGDRADSNRWQLAPMDVAPRSPAENWDSPANAPWPDRSAMAPQQDTPSRRTDPQLMPRVVPRGMNDDTNSYDAEQAGFRSGTDPNSSRRAGAVPAWYDSAPTDRRGSSGATTIQQWPYAPQ